MESARETRYYYLPQLQISVATESRIAAWNAVHQTNRREAGVRISAFVARIDCVEIEVSNAERHQLERSSISYLKYVSHLLISIRGVQNEDLCHLNFRLCRRGASWATLHATQRTQSGFGCPLRIPERARARPSLRCAPFKYFWCMGRIRCVTMYSFFGAEEMDFGLSEISNVEIRF
jgi:hypothetical protein